MLFDVMCFITRFTLNDNLFYLKESSTKSPIHVPNISDIPVQKIELDVPLEITGLATSDQYLEMKQQQNGIKPEKKKKKKKKNKKKDHEGK